MENSVKRKVYNKLFVDMHNSSNKKKVVNQSSSLISKTP